MATRLSGSLTYTARASRRENEKKAVAPCPGQALAGSLTFSPGSKRRRPWSRQSIGRELPGGGGQRPRGIVRRKPAPAASVFETGGSCPFQAYSLLPTSTRRPHFILTDLLNNLDLNGGGFHPTGEACQAHAPRINSWILTRFFPSPTMD